MPIRRLDSVVEDKISINAILVSVYDKTGIADFVRGLMDINSNLVVISSRGTYKYLSRFVDKNLLDVSEYTGFSEMEGGLVKTLHPKIHAGILAERNNQKHEAYLDSIDGRYIDMVVVNLYPFGEVVSRENFNFEDARGNIDIGGPTMLRAASKNFLGCASVCDTNDYRLLLEEIRKEGGITLATRFKLAVKTFQRIADYNMQIENYFSQSELNPERIVDNYLTK